MRQAYIVIGANYGDEGKGLAASSLAKNAEYPVLNVLINGGPQRGHTVDLPDGRRHVFKHFGSGAMYGADSFADEDFFVNPIFFNKEREMLMTEFGLDPKLLVSGKCRVTTPWDMMLGQIIEENRGAARHGSCGMGIQETRLRFKNTDWAMHFGEIINCSLEEMRRYHKRILREYVPGRLEAVGAVMTDEWTDVLNDPGIADAFWSDIQQMREHTEISNSWAAAAEGYSTLVFEAGQGLALDKYNLENFPHLTPSRTTSFVSAERIKTLPGETKTEIVYVTRSYFTRHGAGPFPTECRKEEINPDIVDLTNVPNPHQQSIRYGRFSVNEIMKRIEKDRSDTNTILPVKTAIFVTHLNETGGDICGDTDMARLVENFDKAYCSSKNTEMQEYTK